MRLVRQLSAGVYCTAAGGGGLSFASVSEDCSNLFKCHVVPISSVPVEFEEERITLNFLVY